MSNLRSLLLVVFIGLSSNSIRPEQTISLDEAGSPGPSTYWNRFHFLEMDLKEPVEVLLASTFTFVVGRIVDGKFRTVWTLPDHEFEIGRGPIIGDFDGDSRYDILKLGLADGPISPGVLVTYDVATDAHSKTHIDNPVSSSVVLAMDIDEDGIDEVLTTERRYVGPENAFDAGAFYYISVCVFHRFDPDAGSFFKIAENPLDSRLSRAIVGDFTNDGTEEILVHERSSSLLGNTRIFERVSVYDVDKTGGMTRIVSYDDFNARFKLPHARYVGFVVLPSRGFTRFVRDFRSPANMSRDIQALKELIGRWPSRAWYPIYRGDWQGFHVTNINGEYKIEEAETNDQFQLDVLKAKLPSHEGTYAWLSHEAPDERAVLKLFTEDELEVVLSLEGRIENGVQSFISDDVNE